MFAGPLNRWWNVAAGAVGAMTGAGVFAIYGFGVLARSIMAETHWPRPVLSDAMTVFMLATGVGSVALGSLMARFGIRGPSIVFVAVFALVLAMIGVAPPEKGTFLLLFALLGVSGAAATAFPYATAVSGWFDDNRGLALGLINAAGGFAGVLAPAIALWLAAHHGWRGGFIGFALICGPAPILGLLLLVRTPPGASSRRSQAAPSAGWGETFRRPAFWLISAVVAAIAVASFGVLGVLASLLADRGLSSVQAAGVLSSAGLASWAAKFASGYLLDRVFAPRVAAAVCVVMLAGLALLLAGGSGPSLYIGAALMGVGVGSEADLLTYLVSRYFDLALFSRVVGVLWVMWAWGQGAGSLIAGAAYRLSGRYDAALWVFGGLLLAGAALVSRLPPYRFPGSPVRRDTRGLSIAQGTAPV